MPKVSYHISKADEFVITNYNSSPTFASFFPGIAGIFGSPMWVFYTNRGQAITSAGVHDKDEAIIEFQPANKAYRRVSLTGFRTFIKVNGQVYEPFAQTSRHQNEMRISPYQLVISETNPKLKLRVEVTYFTVPNEAFSALARKVSISNLSAQARQIEVVDGLPTIIPHGFTNDFLKRLSQTIQAWCVVENLDNGAPFYKLKVAPADVSETKYIEKGNFYLAFANLGGKDQAVELIVDPNVVFGQNTSLEQPGNLTEKKRFSVAPEQQTQGILPSAFAFKRCRLKGKGILGLFSLIGQADNVNLLNKLKQRACSKAFLEQKAAENKALIDGICSSLDIASASKSFDLYSRQTFLDNVMRGGLPVCLGSKTMYLYYRKHGDMERDYNDFKLMPTFFSQGNGNYRDINQNRRNDIFFNPEVGADNIIRFFNLIQLDGYNPLVVLGSRLRLGSTEQAQKLVAEHISEGGDHLAEALTRPFILGSLLRFLEESGIKYRTSRQAFAGALLETADIEEDAVHHEGYWIDHAFYNTDLLESYEALFPEKLSALLFDQKIFHFFDNEHVVLPRQQRYCVACGTVRQYQSVRPDLEKQSLLAGRKQKKNIMRTEHGKGKIYKTTLLTKIMTIVANKAATFDPEGIGLEMEADKPDWYDALNGLPALMGSSLSETLELKRLCSYVLDHMRPGQNLSLPHELKEFIDLLQKELADQDSFSYWEKANVLKEAYRQRTKLGVSGREENVTDQYVRAFLEAVRDKCGRAVKRCLSRYKNYYTYFINEAVDYELVNDQIRVKKFKQKPLPLFLEGYVHALKVERDKKIPKLVSQSPLFDKKLKMYKVNASLEETPIEIGRARIFTPGWLENESIWLHMEYKYMLELLKAGCCEEFYADFRNVMIPFLKPELYKRSILENSSFLVSSAHPNQNDHGRGFVARLSGGAAEFIDIWLLMTTGKNIFYLNDNDKLCFKLNPALPKWLFQNGKLSFKLFGEIEVTYLNNKKRNTYGKGVKPIAYKLYTEDKEIDIDQPFVGPKHAALIRDRQIKKIVVTLA
ncbi:MAG: hypothetical protein JW782_02965 [Candidatus Saganbacteria bacterium]|nr:hypothetical protein [Candidatus Saganbacteria bacterium]